MSKLENQEMPIGLGMKLAMDINAMNSFVRKSEKERKEIIKYIQSSSTGHEAKNRVNEVVTSLKSTDDKMS